MGNALWRHTYSLEGLGRAEARLRGVPAIPDALSLLSKGAHRMRSIKDYQTNTRSNSAHANHSSLGCDRMADKALGISLRNNLQVYREFDEVSCLRLFVSDI